MPLLLPRDNSDVYLGELNPNSSMKLSLTLGEVKKSQIVSPDVLIYAVFALCAYGLTFFFSFLPSKFTFLKLLSTH